MGWCIVDCRKLKFQEIQLTKHKEINQMPYVDSDGKNTLIKSRKLRKGMCGILETSRDLAKFYVGWITYTDKVGHIPIINSPSNFHMTKEVAEIKFSEFIQENSK